MWDTNGRSYPWDGGYNISGHILPLWAYNGLLCFDFPSNEEEEICNLSWCLHIPGSGERTFRSNVNIHAGSTFSWICCVLWLSHYLADCCFGSGLNAAILLYCFSPPFRFKCLLTKSNWMVCFHSSFIQDYILHWAVNFKLVTIPRWAPTLSQQQYTLLYILTRIWSVPLD